MKFLFPLLILTLFTTSAAAESRSRGMGLFGGAGFGPARLELDRTTSKSIFSAWQATLELGANYPFTDDLGFTLSSEYAQSDLSNVAGSNFNKETGQWTEKSVKGGFYVNQFGIGYGKKASEVHTTLISVEDGSFSSRLSGTTDFAFLNLSFNSTRSLRFTFESQYQFGPIGTANAQALSLNLRALYFFEKR